MKPKKYYVVWHGRKTGIFDNWEECFEQVNGFKDAKFKSFDTLQQAQKAFEEGFENSSKINNYYENCEVKPILDSFVVDAAYNGKVFEYRGIYLKTKEQIFYFGPMENGSNNIGEFLAIVHCMAFQKKNNIFKPIYSDSQTAIKWVKNKKCNTKATLNTKTAELINRAELWLAKNNDNFEILKWDTALWGEIPADFGRK